MLLSKSVDGHNYKSITQKMLVFTASATTPPKN